MGKTTNTYKGEKHRAKSQKKWKEKKHFGETSGTHSKKNNSIKGKDFIKYGWPLELRNGTVIKNLQKERDADQQLQDY